MYFAKTNCIFLTGVTLSKSEQYNSIYDCHISLHQWEHMSGPNLFQELNIQHKIDRNIRKWFKIPIRSLRTEGDGCCYEIK